MDGMSKIKERIIKESHKDTRNEGGEWLVGNREHLTHSFSELRNYLMKHGIVKELLPRLIDPSIYVRLAAAGALRLAISVSALPFPFLPRTYLMCIILIKTYASVLLSFIGTWSLAPLTLSW